MFDIDKLIDVCENNIIYDDEMEIANESLELVIGGFYMVLGTLFVGAAMHGVYKMNRTPKNAIQSKYVINEIQKSKFIQFQEDKYNDFKEITQKIKPDALKLQSILSQYESLNSDKKEDKEKIIKFINEINKMRSDLPKVFDKYKSKTYKSPFTDGRHLRSELVKIYNDYAEFYKIGYDDIMSSDQNNVDTQLYNAFRNYFGRLSKEIQPYANAVKIQYKGLKYNKEKNK